MRVSALGVFVWLATHYAVVDMIIVVLMLYIDLFLYYGVIWYFTYYSFIEC